ncbi:MAG: hypothetical protein GY934_15905 [Gammaproteobacteria bacterium]|nr:hypothetical protein [Gammaproteobacteria bacterium]
MIDRFSKQLDDSRSTLLLVGAYFLFQLVVRLFNGGGLELDEAEQMLLGQQLQFGYSANPPLYTWLQILFFQIFGQGLFALALLKGLLLFGIYLFLLLTARSLGLKQPIAALAALSLILLPDIGWESQRDLTHSVLVTTLAAATLWWVVQMINGQQQWYCYLLLGLLFGLGMLSKWNYGLFIPVLILGMFFQDRRLVWRPAMVLTLMAMLLILLPYLYWIRDALEIATGSLHKLRVSEEGGFAVRLTGLGSLAKAYLNFGGLFLLSFLLLFRPWGDKPESKEKVERDSARFIRQIFWITLVILIGYMLVSGSARIRARWLMPVLFYLPLFSFLMMSGVRLTARSQRHFQRLLLIMLLVVPLGLMARVYIGPFVGKYTKPHFPAASLAASLQPHVEAKALILAEDNFIGGNLKPYFPDSLILSPVIDLKPSGLESQNPVAALVVWNAEHGGTMPKAMLKKLEQRFGRYLVVRGSANIIEQPLRFSQELFYRLGWQRVDLVSKN